MITLFSHVDLLAVLVKALIRHNATWLLTLFVNRIQSVISASQFQYTCSASDVICGFLDPRKRHRALLQPYGLCPLLTTQDRRSKLA
jgi:hypothetical protein